ncbi:MAG: hypothetical protein WC867_04720 [Candidatus Pacearchaeota archaeon]|jgi:hypothetical protein
MKKWINILKILAWFWLALIFILDISRILYICPVIDCFGGCFGCDSIIENFLYIIVLGVPSWIIFLIIIFLNKKKHK